MMIARRTGERLYSTLYVQVIFKIYFP
jgi:hypothetical protein